MNNVHEIEIKLKDEWIKALDASFKKNSKDVSVDGFRKGSVPKEIYIKKFGIESLYSDAVDTCINVAYKQALDKEKLVPACEPSVDVTGISDTNIIFKFKIITKPEITIGEYKNLGVKKDKVTVSKKEIEEEINHLKEHMADVIVKENGTIAEGDTANINFEGYVDGEKVEDACGENYPLEIGSHTFIPGFEEGLIGLAKDDDKEINLKFPENYVEDLKGKDVLFKVHVNEIKTKVLPELNKEFYEDLGFEDVNTKEEFEKKVEEEIKKRKTYYRDEEHLDKVFEKASENVKGEINQEIYDEEAKRMVRQFSEQLKAQGMNIEAYYKMTSTKEEDLIKQVMPEAQKRVKYRYLLEGIAEAENIKFTKKEIDEGAEILADKYNVTKEELIESFGSLDVVEYDMKMQKAIEILKENN